MTAASDWTRGSEEAFSLITEWRMGRRCGFSVKDWGVGGSFVVVPIDNEGEGGFVGSRDRI
jgi:hypothetical protein